MNCALVTLVSRIIVIVILSCSSLAFGEQAAEVGQSSSDDVSALNANFFYFIGGQVVGARGFVIGDEQKWGASVEGVTGRSKSGKVRSEPVNYQGKGDAIKLTFSRKNIKGDFGLYGDPVNLSAVKDAAALMFDVKVNKKPNKSVLVGMDCGYPCRAEMEVGRQLRKIDKGKWAAFPIPLNCFQSDNFDLKKINGVFLISSDGKMDISIANIRIERLPVGDKGCVNDEN